MEMDHDQLVQRVEWLDDERRSDKNTIADLQKRIAKLEGSLDLVSEQARELGSEVTRLAVLVARVDEFDKSLDAHRTEIKKELEARDERRKSRERETQNLQRTEIDGVNKSLTQIREQIDEIAKLRESIEARKQEETRLQKLINENQSAIREVKQGEEERMRLVRSIEDSRRQDEKRIADMQGEVAAIRKRSDELRGKMELFTDGQRKVETRLNELVAAEAERRESQSAFVDKVTYEMSERERTWKDWQKRFAAVDEQSNALQTRLTQLEDTDRAVKRAQEAFEEMSGQISRRINEITEMQRLSEERFRQDWSTFKADDQKRWTNYTLTQEEQHREVDRSVDKLGDQLTNLEDSLQEVQDVVQHSSEQSEKQLQGLLSMLREWVAENERFSSTLR